MDERKERKMSENKSSSSGISFGSLLTLVFIVLKLTNVINWSWWWVLSPLWISLSITLVILVIVVILEHRKAKQIKELMK